MDFYTSTSSVIALKSPATAGTGPVNSPAAFAAELYKKGIFAENQRYVKQLPTGTPTFLTNLIKEQRQVPQEHDFYGRC